MGDLAGDFMGDGRGEAVGPTRAERRGGEEGARNEQGWRVKGEEEERNGE